MGPRHRLHRRWTAVAGCHRLTHQCRRSVREKGERKSTSAVEYRLNKTDAEQFFRGIADIHIEYYSASRKLFICRGTPDCPKVSRQIGALKRGRKGFKSVALPEELTRKVATSVQVYNATKDNAPHQYRCRQTFIQIASVAERRPGMSIVHNLAVVDNFKGVHDGCNKEPAHTTKATL